MISLVNPDNNKSLTLPDKDAEAIFGNLNGVTSIVCMPSKMPIQKVKSPNLIVHSLTRKRGRVTKIGGIAVIRMGGLGDLICLSSSLKKIKLKNPNKPLTLATLPQNIDIFKNLSFIDHCISVNDVVNYKFNKVIDLRYAVEPASIGNGKASWFDYISKERADMFDTLCGVNSNNRYFTVPIRNKLSSDWIKGYARPFIAINATSKSPVRVIPPEFIKPIIEKLHKWTKGTVVLIGQTEQWSTGLLQIKDKRVANLINKTTTNELLEVCSLMDLFITPDSAVMHIAGALQKNCLAIFGNIDPATRISYYPTVKALYPKGQLPCVPCWDVPETTDACMERGTFGARCMRFYNPWDIANEAVKMLN